MHIILVHGAWHGGWCWWRLKELLEECGHIVHTPTLSGLADRSHISSNVITLKTHIDDIRNIIFYNDIEQCLLVGHSYADMVITGVADMCSDKIYQLVYLDAVVPKSGNSFIDCLPPKMLLRKRIERTQEEYIFCTIKENIFGIKDKQDVHKVINKLTPHPKATMVEKLFFDELKHQKVNKCYIDCHEAISSTSSQEWKFLPQNNWKYILLNTGHDAMITLPNQLAAILVDLVH